MAAAMKVVFSQGRCHCRSPYLVLYRYLSSDPSPVQPVSYSPKPKPQAPLPHENQNQNQNQDQIQSQSGNENAQPSPQAFANSEREKKQSIWTREDFRYVKDAPSVSPVTYLKRVAPLPEDRREEEGQEMEWERRRIEAENRGPRRAFRVIEEEEKIVLPFPRLIRPEKKEKKPLYDLMDAIREVKANARKTFDETLEAHARLGIDKSRSDLIVRGTLTLPHGGKKAFRLAVFAEGADADEARAAGADVVGGVELIDQIASAGKIDFDKCLATPQMLRHVIKIARLLNPHGLMPNPKDGTLVSDVAKSVNIEKNRNQIKFKMDKTSIVHVGLGQLSFSEESLRENVGAFMNALLQAKPAGLKKTSKYAGYVNSFHICSTMGPGFPVSIQSLSKAVDHYNKVQLK